MSQSFFHRLRNYYLKVAEVLRGDADVASVFPNATNTGMSREKIYADFLRQHAPSKCNVFLGGFLFDDNGIESKQLDVIATTDTTPRFHFRNQESSGKSFSPVEGAIGAASIKSMLDKAQIEDALSGIASIPPMKSLEGRISFAIEIYDYDDWPYKIVYATNGLAGETILQHVNSFYAQHPDIPITRRPHIIHVAGKYVIMRIVRGMKLFNAKDGAEKELPQGNFHLFTRDPDLQGILWVLDGLQQNAAASAEITFSYRDLIKKVNLVS
jgi:hypothetical protein